MDVNSMSTYVNKASSSNGFSGLASGIDTESLVESMLSATQAKIDKQNGVRQQIEWKQEIYRDLISQINSFQSQFFSSSSKTNLLSQTFFNVMNAVSASEAFRVNATSSAAIGNTSVEVRRLASSTSLTSGAGVSGKLAGTLDIQALDGIVQKQLGTDADYTVEFQVNNQVVRVNLRDVFVEGNKFKSFSSAQERDAAIQEKMQKAFEGTGIEATVENGSLSLRGTDKTGLVTVSSTSGALGLKRLGLTAGARSQVSADGKTTSLSGKINEKPELTFSVTLDDLKKDISIDLRDVMDAGGSVDASLFEAALSAQLDKAHGIGQVKAVFNGNDFELVVSQGRKVVIGGTEDVMAALGVKNGQSNRIGMGGSLKDLFFSTPLQGSVFKFTINGEEFRFTENDTMSDIVSAINRSDAGVRLVYRAQDDTFTMEVSESGAGRKIAITQEEGNLLNALFGSGAAGAGILSGSRISSEVLTTGSVKGTSVLGPDDTVKEGTLNLTVDGKNYSFSIPRKAQGEYTVSELRAELNKPMDKAFGAGNIRIMDDGSLKVSNGAAVKVNIQCTNPDDPELTKAEAKAGNLGVALFGTKSISNVADENSTLGELGLEGLVGKDGQVLDKNTKLSQLKDLTEGLSFEDGRIVATGTGTLVIGDKETTQKLFGTDSLVLGVASGANAVLKEGENALIKIDGLLTERSSNNFSVNGLNFDLQDLTGTYSEARGEIIDGDGNPLVLSKGQYIEDGILYDADGAKLKEGLKYRAPTTNDIITATGISYDPATGGARIFNGKAETVEVSRNTDQIVDGIKEFIDGYNKLIKTLNDYISEDASYRKYAPLTEAQKKEMSEKEIELWEEKAKEGLLRNDSTISAFLSDMRTSLYEKTSSGYALYDIGIETGEWESKGQLVLTSDGEAKLRQMLERDPGGVQQMFTDMEDGLAVKLNEIIDKTANVSSGSPGSLVELAGIKGKATENNNELTRRLKDIDERIDALKRTYEKEKARYWRQFNAMEQVIANMNSQSSWLTQQLG